MQFILVFMRKTQVVANSTSKHPNLFASIAQYFVRFVCLYF